MTRELARGLRYSVPISLCMWLAAIGIVLLCSADFADRKPTSPTVYDIARLR